MLSTFLGAMNMGITYSAKCNKCGATFLVTDKGGLNFETIRCDRCGKTKNVNRKIYEGSHKKHENHAEQSKYGGTMSESVRQKSPECGSLDYSDDGGVSLCYD